MDIGLQPAAWHEFFALVGTASAALAGLFFVAISLHFREVEAHPVLRNRARLNLQALILFLAISMAVLIPGQSARLVGVELIVVIVVFLAIGFIGAADMRRHATSISAVVWIRLLVIGLLGILGIGAGASLILGLGPGLYLDVPAIVVGLPMTGFMAWRVVFPPELGSARPSDRHGKHR